MAANLPSASSIRSAKANAIGGGSKRCKKGKSCSATCIDPRENCLVDMPEAVGIATTKVSNMLISRKQEAQVGGSGVVTAPPSPPAQQTITPAPPPARMSERFDQSKKTLGSGMYGVVRETDTGSVIKKGDIGENEVSIQRKLADIKGVPKVLGVEYFPGSARGGEKKGIIEMQKANGTALIDQTSKSDHKVKGAEASKALDEYIRLRKDIHTRGIAHGDMHDANVTWDGKNMGLIDFGSSKEGYKAALAEALGTGGVDHAKYLMSNLKGWGASSPKEEKLQSNFGKVQQKATKKDLTEDEAKKLIEELYDGI